VNVLRFNRGRCALNPALKSISSFGYSGTNAHIVAASDEWCKHLGTTDMEFLWHRLEFNQAEDSGSPMINMRGHFLHLKGTCKIILCIHAHMHGIGAHIESYLQTLNMLGNDDRFLITKCIHRTKTCARDVWTVSLSTHDGTFNSAEACGQLAFEARLTRCASHFTRQSQSARRLCFRPSSQSLYARTLSKSGLALPSKLFEDSKTLIHHRSREMKCITLHIELFYMERYRNEVGHWDVLVARNSSSSKFHYLEHQSVSRSHLRKRKTNHKKPDVPSEFNHNGAQLSLYEIVSACYRDVSFHSFMKDKTLIESGMDSLGINEFFARLQQQLGCRIPAG